MFGGKRDLPLQPAEYQGRGRGAPLPPVLVNAAVLFVSLVVSQQLISRFGLDFFILALVGAFFGTLYAIVSLKSLLVPFIVWVLSVGGFRYIWSIQTPILPDLFLDRMMMLWLAMVFMVKFFAERRTLKGPFLLDYLIAIHGLYVLIRIYIQGMEYIHPWTMSYLIPYAAYYFSKNIVTTIRRIWVFLVSLLLLTLYYSITSIAENLGLNFLVWPKLILTERIRWGGRSTGPFLQPGVLGTVIGMLVPIHLYFIATVRSNVTRVGVYVSLALGMAGLYYTYTRGSWLAGIVAILVVAALNIRHYSRVLLPAVVLVPVLAFSFLGLGQDTFMKERVENEDTLGSRVGTAVTALKIWRDNPLIGVGFFQYRNAREDYIQPITVPGLGTIRFVQFRHNNIHDIYLGPLAEDGLVGMGLQFWIYFLILKTFLKKFRWRHEGDHFAIFIMPVFAGVFVGYLVGGLAIDYRFFSFIGVLFYMCAGILYGYQRPEQENVS